MTFNLSKYKFNCITLLPKNFKVWLPDMANKNTEHLDKFQFQMNNEYFLFLSINVSPTVFGTYLY